MIYSLDPFYLLVFALGVGFFLGSSLEAFLAARRRKARTEQNRWRRSGRRAGAVVHPSWRIREAPAGAAFDASDQLRVVMGADFSRQPILNKREARVFKELDRMVIERNPGWQVMAQVSLGEVLRCKDEQAFRCINSKRVDLLLMDEACEARHALEYQGGGHHQGSAAARDAVKKEALRRAGIGYHEVVAGHTTPSELRRLVEKLVPPHPHDAGRAAAAPDRVTLLNDDTSAAAPLPQG